MVTEIVGLVEQSISFISLDPKRLTVMIMKTESDRAIKGFLNQLFKKNRSDKWNSYDTTIAISYLIQSKFRHIDLLVHHETIDLSGMSVTNVVTKAIEDADLFMREGKYDSAFDRVHTAFHGYLRWKLDNLGVKYEESDTLHQYI